MTKQHNTKSILEILEPIVRAKMEQQDRQTRSLRAKLSKKRKPRTTRAEKQFQEHCQGIYSLADQVDPTLVWTHATSLVEILRRQQINGQKYHGKPKPQPGTFLYKLFKAFPEEE